MSSTPDSQPYTRSLLWLVALLASVGLMVAHVDSRSLLSPTFWLSAVVPMERGGVQSFSLLLVGAMAGLALAAWLSPGTRRRLAVMLVGLGLLGGGIGLAGLSPAWAMTRLGYGLVVAAMLLAALACGLRLLGICFKVDDLTALETVALAQGLGLILLSTAVLLLGVAGLASQLTAVALLIGMFLSGAPLLGRALRDAFSEALDATASLPALGWMALGVLLSAVVLLTPAAFYPPLDYDVLEYHLQMPREYVDLGGVQFLAHNAFSGFPQAMEMLTYLSFLLADGYTAETMAQTHGLWIAKVLNAAFLPLLLLAVILAVRRLAGEPRNLALTAGLITAVLALGGMRTFTLPMLLYIELGMGAYTMLAVLALIIAWQSDSALRPALLCGLMAGAASCCKYTGLLWVGGPVCALLFLVPGRVACWRSRLRCAVLAGLLCWGVLAPWLIKNAITTGNPLYPLWNQAFGVTAWSETQEARFQIAHRPAYQGLGAATFAPRTLVQEAYRLFVGGRAQILGRSIEGHEMGVLALLFWPGLLMLRVRTDRGQTLSLLAWVGACFLFWFFLTHRLERFFHQGYLLAALVSGAGLAALLRAAETCRLRRGLVRLLGTGALVLAALTMAVGVGSEYLNAITSHPATAAEQVPVLRVLLGLTPAETMVARNYAPWGLRQSMARDPSLQHGQVLLVGSADPFWLPKNVRYAVVFSQHPLWQALAACKDAHALAAALRQRGITHLYINWPELARLYATYHEAYRLNAAQQTCLRDLLRVCAYRPLAMPWSTEALRQGWRRTWSKDQTVLLPEGRPGGPYCLAPYELFALPQE